MNDPLAPYENGPAGNTRADQAIQIVQQFLSSLGWPRNVDGLALAGWILRYGYDASPERAYNVLFAHVSPALQKAHPNAEFGLSYDAWVTQTNALKDSFDYFTGNPDIPHDILRMAIDQQWTQAEMLTFLQKDSRFTDPSQMPWLTQGMGYRDVKNQFVQVYGKAPTNPDQLASWFNFRTGAAQVSAATPAITAGLVPPQKTPSQSETR